MSKQRADQDRFAVSAPASGSAPPNALASSGDLNLSEDGAEALLFETSASASLEGDGAEANSLEAAPIELLQLPGERRFVFNEDLKAAHYPLGALLGEGAMGLVYVAKDESLGRAVALKTLRADEADNEDYRRALTFEARLTGQLEHPNIVPVHELGTLEDGRPFYTMKLVGQTSLSDVLYQLKMKRPKSVAYYTRTRLLQLFRGICMAVEYAHARGVVHRDLKPDNVLIGDYGEVQILDWGVARVLPQGGRPGYFAGQVEEPGLVVGTPHYMSPEQARGETDAVDARSDVYSLGIILYQLLTHTLPFEHEATVEQLEKVLHAPIEPPRQRAPELEIPSQLEAICMAALSPCRERRFRSARALWEAIEHFLEGERDHARRQALAHQLTQEGLHLTERYYALDTQLQHRLSELSRSDKESSLLASPFEREQAWQDQLHLQEQELVHARLFAEAVTTFQRVLAYVPTHPEATHHLGLLYRHWAERARSRGDWAQAILYADLARALAPEAPDARGVVHVRTYPEGAQCRVLHVRESGSAEVFRGPSPVNALALQPGSYLVAANLPGHAERRTTLIVEADRVSRALLTLPAWDNVLATLSHSEEVATLGELFGRCVRHQRLIVACVTGEAGLGKRRLLDDFSHWLEHNPQPFNYSAVRLNSHHRHVPFFALGELIAHSAGITRNSSFEDVHQRLFTLLRDIRLGSHSMQISPTQTLELQREAELLASLPTLRRHAKPLKPCPTRLEQLFELLISALRELAQRAPLVLVIRGAEHLDPYSRRMFVALRRSLQRYPVFLLLASRDGRVRSASDYEIKLTPLSPERLAQQLAFILNGPADESLVALVQQLSQGNAFLVVETARLLLRQQRIEFGPKGWVPKKAPPTHFEALLFEELESLAPTWRTILEAAAIQGATFWMERLELPTLSPEAITHGLQQLCHHEWIQARPISRYPNMHEYSFKHDNFQRALHHQSPPERTQREHLRLAHWLSSHPGYNLEDIALAARHAHRSNAKELERQLMKILEEAASPWGDSKQWMVRHLKASSED